MLFTSDNWAGIHPAIMDALVAANNDMMPAYGGDEITTRAEAMFNELFERDVSVFFVTTGGAANGLALSTLVPPFGATLCHEISHVQMDEAGLPEFYTGGAKLLTAEGKGGKLTEDAVIDMMRVYAPPVAHHVQPRALSLTQATEYGTCYSLSEITTLCESAKRFGLKIHMDGARFSNAAAHLECTPADMTWRAGIDVLSFGATKNGAMAAEAVVFFDKDLADQFIWRQKRAGHLWSKGRFLAAQWTAFLQDDLWLKLARHANQMAQRLADGLSAVDGVTVHQPTQANEVFVTLPEPTVQRLRQQGAQFYDWIYPGDIWRGQLKRLVTSYATTEQEIEQFLAIAQKP